MNPSWPRDRLWRERDWKRALERALAELPLAAPDRVARTIELGRAFEHIHPDRRRAIAAYAAAGPGRDGGRARELATELGWWPALARLALLETPLRARLLVDELTAWVDAGEPALAASLIHGARGIAPDDQELRALEIAFGGGDPLAESTGLAEAGRSRNDAGLLIGAARLARLGGDRGAAYRHLVAARAIAPGHWRATALLLDLAGQDEAGLRELLQVLLADLEPEVWLDMVRAIGTRLAIGAGTRGLGLRLLRHALERAYASGLDMPAHLATWSVLAEHGEASGSRHELMTLAGTALEHTADHTDRVWLMAFGAETSWRDDGDLEAARSWAELLAELAPEHPIVLDVRAALVAEEPDAALVYLDHTSAGAPRHGLAEMLRTAVLAVESAVAAAARDDDFDIDIDEAPAAAPPAAARVAREALAAAARVAESPPRPPDLIPRAALGVLGKLSGRPPRLPVKAAIASAHPRAARMAVPLDAVVRTPDGASHAVVCRDISTSGVFILTDRGLPIGDVVELSLRTPTSEPWREQGHSARARVVRRESRGYGLELIEPPATLLAQIEKLDAS